MLIALAAIVVFASTASGGHRSLVSAFTAWDGQWYVSIADSGYLPGPGVDQPTPPPGADITFDGGVAFFPLYPLIVGGLLDVVPFPTDVMAIVLSFAIGAAASAAFARFSAAVTSRDAARRSVYLFCFFPGAYILSLAYPEGLLIFLACMCLFWLLRRSWLLAGLAAAAASATRPNGVALIVPCLIASWSAVRGTRDYRSLIAPILAPLGVGAFLSFLWIRTGDPWYWFRANGRFWHDRIGGWPELDLLLGGAHPQVSGDADRSLLVAGLLGGSLVVIVLVVLMFRAHLPVVVTSYAITYQALGLLNQALAPRPRFIFAAFPLVLGLGVWAKDRWFDLVLAASAGSMVLLFVFYTLPWLEGRLLVAP